MNNLLRQAAAEFSALQTSTLPLLAAAQHTLGSLETIMSFEDLSDPEREVATRLHQWLALLESQLKWLRQREI